MSKFLLNLVLQISKALVNSKTQFLIQKLFSLLSARPTPRPVRPLAQPAHQPCRFPQAETVPAGPSSPCIGRVFAGNTFSFSDHAFPSRPPLPHLSVNRAPPVRINPFPALADPGQNFSAPSPRPGAPPPPYKRRAPPPELTTPLPASLRFSPRSSFPLTERYRLPILHHRRPASTAPPEIR
jgi:hypothetical protein